MIDLIEEQLDILRSCSDSEAFEVKQTIIKLVRESLAWERAQTYRAMLGWEPVIKELEL